MKTKTSLVAIILLVVTQINFSCKKDISCKGCYSNSPDKSPIAIAGSDQQITSPADSLLLDGSASYDSDGKIIAWLWTKISGPSGLTIITSTSSKTIVKNLTPGIYQFELKVTDTEGLSSKDTMQLTVMSQPALCKDCKIVFVSNRDGNHEIYSCHTDGTQITRLTYDAGFDGEPAWSPDGSRIAFISDRTGRRELYIMNADGSNVIRKTFSRTYTEFPAWSPDGTKIAYASLSNGSSNIWMVDVATGVSKLLFEAPGWDSQPAWSPDGSKIALVSDWAAYDIVYGIYSINTDGSGFTSLTSGSFFDGINYLHPSWSPAGTKLAVTIHKCINIDQYDVQIGVVNPDGTGLKGIIPRAAPNTRTCWSGDGTRIIYTSVSGLQMDVSWVYADGSASGTIISNGWNADWQ